MKDFETFIKEYNDSVIEEFGDSADTVRVRVECEGDEWICADIMMRGFTELLMDAETDKVVADITLHIGECEVPIRITCVDAEEEDLMEMWRSLGEIN